MDYSQDQLEQAQKRLSGWIGHNGIVGTAIIQDEGKDCLLVMTDGATEQTRQVIQSQFAGYPIKFKETGPFVAYA